MSTRKKSSDSFVRCYEVSDPTLHPKGHTIYKITQRTIQADAPDGNVQEVVVWRRYNDIKRLYKALSYLHQTLHRKEEFPPFSRSKVFGRFDHTVIIERMRSCQDLLNFVGQRMYLVKSQAFLEFFEGGETLEIDISKCELLKPTTRCQLECDVVSLSDMSEDDAGVVKESSATEVIASSSRDQLGDSLGGVWQYRRTADEISLHDDDDDDSSYVDDSDVTHPQTDVADDDTSIDVTLPKVEIDLFDPLAGRDVCGEDDEHSNAWLLSATPMGDERVGEATVDDDSDALLEELEKELVSSIVDTSTDIPNAGDAYRSTVVVETPAKPEPISTNPGRVDVSRTNSRSSFTSSASRSRSSSTVECGKGDLTSPVHEASPALPLSGSKSNSPKHSTRTRKSDSVTSSPRHQGVAASVDLKAKADYIFQAAHHISLALQCEVSGNYFMAFNYYKSGIGILLTGVQLDENEKRRDIVRKKTAKYLMKAESLHIKYLAGGESTDHWDTRLTSTENTLQPDVAFLRGPISELANYRVLGVIDKVQLVMDKVTETTYVIKVLYKSCTEPAGPTIVPTICPFMVRLYRYYETSNAIYLLLQHAPGSHLWNYISSYLNQSLHTPQFDDHLDNKQPDTRVVEEVIDVKSEVDTNTTEKCAESYTKLFTEKIIAPSPEVGHGNCDVLAVHNNCKDGANSKRQCRTRSDSLGSDVSAEFTMSGNVHQTPQLRRMSSGKFGELLKGSDAPVDQFSINSFDSDLTPGGARYSSTTDYIETVPELSESLSPAMSPSKHVMSSMDEDVFIEKNLDCQLTEIHKTSNGDCLRSDHELPGANTSPLHRHGEVSMDEIISRGTEKTFESDDEPSIYDRPQSTTCDTDSLHNPDTCTDAHTEPTKSSEQNSDNVECSQSSTVKTSSDACTNSTDDQKNPPMFRMPSQERSLETHPTGPAHKRSRAGRLRTLSSVFGDLDLADDEVEMSSSARLPETCVRQWIMEMLVAVTRLHQLGIVCRDLRPANVLLGDHGHVILSYFSWWSSVDAATPNQLAVSQLYAAPEVSQVCLDVSEASDWWSVGSLMYELLIGRSLASCHPSGINSHTCLLIPDHVSPEAQSLLQQLLKFNPSERLGSGEGGVEDIRTHPFFAGVHWPSLRC